MRKIISTIIFLIVLLNAVIVIYMFKGNIIDFVDNFKRSPSILENNTYQNNVTPNSFSITNDFEPDNFQDLVNIYYTVLSSGMNEFTFYCSKEYKDCIEDIKELTSDDILLSSINNFVHVYNSFKKIRTKYSENGKILLIIEKVYSEEMIQEIEAELDELYATLVSDKKTDKQNIKTIHNYIINNTKYDIDFANDNSLLSSNTAYGLLFDKYGICSGYTDLMSLFLYRMNITNYKISNDKHIWNYVYVDDEWLHLDLTWDDPVQPNNQDVLRYYFLLVETEDLTQYDDEEMQHEFDIELYEK